VPLPSSPGFSARIARRTSSARIRRPCAIAVTKKRRTTDAEERNGHDPPGLGCSAWGAQSSCSSSLCTPVAKGTAGRASPAVLFFEGRRSLGLVVHCAFRAGLLPDREALLMKPECSPARKVEFVLNVGVEAAEVATVTPLTIPRTHEHFHRPMGSAAFRPRSSRRLARRGPHVQFVPRFQPALEAPSTIRKG
jgi:hypothetical protein